MPHIEQEMFKSKKTFHVLKVNEGMFICHLYDANCKWIISHNNRKKLGKLFLSLPTDDQGMWNKGRIMAL